MIATSQQAPLVDFTDEALEKVKAKVKEKGVNGVRFGLTGGGCAGFSYEFDSMPKAHLNYFVTCHFKMIETFLPLQ